MINYEQKPHCYKCYWRNYFTDNQPAGTVFINSKNTAMYLIVNQSVPPDDVVTNDLQQLYSIIDLQNNSILQQGLNLTTLLDFLCQNRCMTTYAETHVQYRYVRDFDNCVCSCNCGSAQVN